MTMKTYIKPNTDVTNVIFEGNLMAGTNGPAVNNDPSQKVSSPEDILGKENEISTPSLWEEEE